MVQMPLGFASVTESKGNVGKSSHQYCDTVVPRLLVLPFLEKAWTLRVMAR